MAANLYAAAILNGLGRGANDYVQNMDRNKLLDYKLNKLKEQDSREKTMRDGVSNAYYDATTEDLPNDFEGAPQKTSFNKPEYLAGLKQTAGDLGDADLFGKVEGLEKVARQEGFSDLYLSIKSGDYEGGVDRFNKSGGRFKIKPGTLKIKGSKAEWVNDEGKKRFMSMTDLASMGGHTSIASKGFGAFGDDGIFSKDTGAVTRSPSGGKDANNTKDLITLKDGSTRSIGQIIKQFEVSFNAPSELELMQMSPEEQKAERVRLDGAFDKWTEKQFGIQLDGGYQQIRQKELMSKKKSALEELRSTGDAQAWAAKYKVDPAKAQALYDEMIGESKMNGAEPIVEPKMRPDQEADQFAEQLGQGPISQPTAKETTSLINQQIQQGMKQPSQTDTNLSRNFSMPVNTPGESKGADYTDMAMAYTKVNNAFNSGEGVIPQKDDLVKALRFATGQGNTDMVNKITAVMVKYYK